MIDLSLMTGIQIDPARRTARAQGGVLWGQFDRECQRFGLATTAGIVTHTGIAGLTLGGGIGHLMRKHGLTCDNLLSVQLVTAQGELVHASDDEEPELFWAVRGGGGNFGIVISFEYRLHPVGPTQLAGLVMHRAERATEVLRFYRDFVAQAPRELGSVVSLRTAPALPWVPEDLRGRPVVAIPVCYAGPAAEGERVLQPLRDFGPPAADLIMPKAYLEPGDVRHHRATWVALLLEVGISTTADRCLHRSAGRHGLAKTFPAQLHDPVPQRRGGSRPG